MVMERFDFDDDPKSRKYRAVTKRVLVLGVVCLILTVMMVAVVIVVLLTAEKDTEQPVNAAALQRDSTSSYLDQNSLWSFSVTRSLSTQSLLGVIGSSSVMSSVLVTSNTYHITTSFNIPVTQRPMTSSSFIIESTDLPESSPKSPSKSSLLPFSTSDLVPSSSFSVYTFNLDSKSSISIDDTYVSIPVPQSSVYNPVSLSPSELSTFVSMETSQLMSSGYYALSSSFELSDVSSVLISFVKTTGNENVTPNFHLTSSEVMTSFLRSEVRSHVHTTQGSAVRSHLQPTVSQEHASSNLLISTTTSDVSTTSLHPSETDVSSMSVDHTFSSSSSSHSSTAVILSSPLGSHYSSVDEKTRVTSYISDSMMLQGGVSSTFSGSVTLQSSTLRVISPSTYSQYDISTLLLPTSSGSVTLKSSSPIVISPSAYSQYDISTLLLPTSSGSVTLKSSSPIVISPSTYSQYDVSTPLLPSSVSSQQPVPLVSSPSTMLQSSLSIDLITSTSDILDSAHPSSTIVPTRASVLSSWASDKDSHSSTSFQSSVHPTQSSVYTSERRGATPTTTTTDTPTITTTLIATSNPCPIGEAPCDDGTCLSVNKFCDGVANCPDTSDEARDCSCGSGQFKCSSGQCVSSLARCDGRLQCKDKTDEFNCSVCLGFQCDSGLCLWTHSSQCNQVVDCDDLSDELRCPFRPGYRRCTNGIFIQASDWCNGVDDCYDNSDETNCECEPLTEVACQAGGCIRREWVCDGVWDCNNGTDEEGCHQCSSTEFVCPDYQCVAMDTICDGRQDCSGGEDELNCFSILSTDQFNASLTAGQLLVQHSGQIQPVCSSHWTQQLSDNVCLYLGHEKSVQTVYTTELSSPQNFYFELKSDVTILGSSEILGSFVNVTTCSNGSLVNISCSRKECGKRSEDFLTVYIAGGELSPLGKWPWVASLTYLGQPLCAAAIVTSQWLVTAGHCVALPGVHDYTRTPFYVQASAGSVKRSTDQKSHRNMVSADRIVQHPNFTFTGLGSILWDLALVHLERPLTITEVIQPICLPEEEEEDSFVNHDNCYLAGWGFLDNDGGQLPQYMREAKVSVWEDEACQQDTVPMETSVNTNITLCAGYPTGILSGCQGDSGGPLMCEATTGHWFLAGVLSSGSANCAVAPTRADRYTRVSALKEWISDMIRTP